jgi:hypothetical protein
MGQPGLGALMQPSTDYLRHFCLHQFLGEQPETVAQELWVGSLLGLVQQVE